MMDFFFFFLRSTCLLRTPLINGWAASNNGFVYFKMSPGRFDGLVANGFYRVFDVCWKLGSKCWLSLKGLLRIFWSWTAGFKVFEWFLQGF